MTGDNDDLVHRAMELTGARFVVDITETHKIDGEYSPIAIKEGEYGYWTTDWKWGKDLESAREIAKDYNRELGLTDEEVSQIVLYSMRVPEPDLHEIVLRKIKTDIQGENHDN